MFAPRHQASAAELAWVCRAGGTIRPPELDASRLHRTAVRDHEAVQPARLLVRSRCRSGQTMPTCTPCSATGSPMKKPTGGEVHRLECRMECLMEWEDLVLTCTGS